MINEKAIDKAAPMPSAPMKYREDGSVAWGEMWDSFCLLAKEGGPPHRGDLLAAQADVDPTREGYQTAVREIMRGIEEVSGLATAEARPGWIGVHCPEAGQANWLAEAIITENVAALAEGNLLLVPVGDYYSLKGEIKNVITAVAKTTHYWDEHLPAEVKQTFKIQHKLAAVREKIGRWFK